MAVKLNNRAVSFVESMIKQGNVNRDAEWGVSEPTPESENAYLDTHSYDEYGNWFLGIDPDTNPDTKEHYSFPVGDFKQIYRSGLIAAEQRAGQYHHEDIKATARKLLDMVD